MALCVAAVASLLLVSQSVLIAGAAAVGNGERDKSRPVEMTRAGLSATDTYAALPLTPEAEFEAYQQKFDRSYEHGSKEYWFRRGLFEERNSFVKDHNANPYRLWQAEAGRFADMDKDERASFHGYRSNRRMGRSQGAGKRLPQEAEAARELLRPIQNNASLPAKFDWLHLKVAKYVPDQLQCGSCWAVTAKSVLDAHHEIYMGFVRNFSAQQIVSCTPDPRNCGGQGKCQGATVELAFNWTLFNGCASDADVPYVGQDLTEAKARCNESRSLSKVKSLWDVGTPHEPIDSTMVGSTFGMWNWTQLPANQEGPLKLALYQHGPVATSACANDWFEYGGGIMSGCNASCIVNHAITLYGYGEAVVPHPEVQVLTNGETATIPSTDVKYWLIRNSWGKSWGEKGYIRLLRYDEENQHCGQDTDNSQGVGCDGDPQVVTVCGMCGFLWDSVYPVFHHNGTTHGGLVQTDVSAEAKLIRRH